jgi:hypothetical protein
LRLAEFPRIQQTFGKFRPNFLVITVNVIPKEDPIGVRIMARRRYDFINLTTPDPLWTKENWNGELQGTNLLIDADGRVIFKTHISDEEDQRVFEQQIKTLFAKANLSNSGE